MSIILKIGFVGYSDGKFDIDKAKEILDKIFTDIAKNNTKVEIVSGATALGIPKLVYEYAQKYNYMCTGIMCKDGYNYELYPCDRIFAYGNNWGDESPIFINYIDVLYKIGGGKQSQKEIEMAKDANKQVYEYDLAFPGK